MHVVAQGPASFPVVFAFESCVCTLKECQNQVGDEEIDLYNSEDDTDDSDDTDDED